MTDALEQERQRKEGARCGDTTSSAQEHCVQAREVRGVWGDHERTDSTHRSEMWGYHKCLCRKGGKKGEVQKIARLMGKKRRKKDRTYWSVHRLLPVTESGEK